MQLSLWHESEAATTIIPLPEIGGTIEYTNGGWADGDVSEAALERLARLLLQPGLGIETFDLLPAGAILDMSTHVWFRTVATRIEGTSVIQTLERIKPLVTSAWRLQGAAVEDESEG